jgi:hypothetical protein
VYCCLYLAAQYALLSPLLSLLLLLLLQRHVQKSVPILLDTNTALEAAAAELQVCLAHCSYTQCAAGSQ